MKAVAELVNLCFFVFTVALVLVLVVGCPLAFLVGSFLLTVMGYG